MATWKSTDLNMKLLAPFFLFLSVTALAQDTTNKSAAPVISPASVTSPGSIVTPSAPTTIITPASPATPAKTDNQDKQEKQQPVLIDKIVGIVGDKVILLSDIELQYHQMKLEQPNMTPDAKCGILDQMMTSKMYLEQALLDSIKVTDEEVESELDRRIRYFVNMIGSEEKLEAYYEKSISQIKDEFKSDIREQLLSQREQAKIFEDVKITPTEVKAFYNKLPKDSLPYFNAEVEIGQIVIYPKVSSASKQLAMEKIEGLRDRIQKGEDFAKLARIYSEDPGSADKGGDLGTITRGQMVTEFEAAAYNLQDSMELSPIFETKFGYHIIQLLDRRGEKLHVRHILIKAKVTSSDLSFARARLDSVRRLIVEDSISFSKAVGKYSEDEGTKYQGGTLQNQQTGNGYFEIAQLDKSIYFTIEKLQPGEISEPVLYQTAEGDQAYRILYLKSETKPHQANLTDDFYKIKAGAQARKQDEALKKWLMERIQSSFTYLDMNYQNCNAVKKWFKSNDVIEKKYE